MKYFLFLVLGIVLLAGKCANCVCVSVCFVCVRNMNCVQNIAVLLEHSRVLHSLNKITCDWCNLIWYFFSLKIKRSMPSIGRRCSWGWTKYARHKFGRRKTGLTNRLVLTTKMYSLFKWFLVDFDSFDFLCHDNFLFGNNNNTHKMWMFG